MVNCPNCGRVLDIGAQYCSNCGSRILDDPQKMSAGGTQPQMEVATKAPTPAERSNHSANSNEKLQANLSRALRPNAKEEDKFLARVPHMAALQFWLIVGGLLLFYDGVSEIVLHYGSGLGFAIGAILVGFFYIYLSWSQHQEQGKGWVLQASLGDSKRAARR